jgi:hypothetical protein
MFYFGRWRLATDWLMAFWANVGCMLGAVDVSFEVDLTPRLPERRCPTALRGEYHQRSSPYNNRHLVLHFIVSIIQVTEAAVECW